LRNFPALVIAARKNSFDPRHPFSTGRNTLMNLLNSLERKFGRFAVPHLTLALIISQVVIYVFAQAPARGEGGEPLLTRLELIPERVLAGEVWRLVTFLVEPPLSNPICAFFFWYLFYLMGTALESHWGVFRYNVYLLIGYVATVSVSFLTPETPAANTYLQSSVFLAFAFLHPDFELCLFFLLPVKIKWLALLTWIGLSYVLIFDPWFNRLQVLASVCNFLLFFGHDLILKARAGHRRMAWQAARFAVKEPEYFHKCLVCGITDRTHRDMDFRYCSQCHGSCCYCSEHLRSHDHVAAGEMAPGR
jgi:hypothetical protein